MRNATVILFFVVVIVGSVSPIEPGDEWDLDPIGLEYASMSGSVFLPPDYPGVDPLRFFFLDRIRFIDDRFIEIVWQGEGPESIDEGVYWELEATYHEEFFRHIPVFILSFVDERQNRVSYKIVITGESEGVLYYPFLTTRGLSAIYRVDFNGTDLPSFDRDSMTLPESIR